MERLTGHDTYPLKPNLGADTSWDMSRDIKQEAAA